MRDSAGVGERATNGIAGDEIGQAGAQKSKARSRRGRAITQQLKAKEGSGREERGGKGRKG